MTSSEILSIDIETRSSVDLAESGVYVYAQAPDFDILLFGYAFGSEPVRVIDLRSGESLPADVLAALSDPAVTKTAWNANFERTCLAAYLGREMDPAQWECSMVRAMEAGLPASLKVAGLRLGLTEDERKMKEGPRLISLFCQPVPPSLINNGDIWNEPEDLPDEWEMFCGYNAQDVVAEREIRKRLPKIHPGEQRLWEIDQTINDRGIRIWTPFVRAAAGMMEDISAELMQRARDITGLENPNSPVQLKGWFSRELGRPVTKLDKKALPGIIAEAPNETIREVAQTRAQLGKASVTKYQKMLDTSCSDDRIRGTMAFFGAGRTGRWAGRGFQPQNLVKNNLDDLDTPRAYVRWGDRQTLEMLYDSVPDVLSQLIRTAIIPTDGCRFIVSDFSAIEARVIAWLAGERWRLEVFRRGGKIYEESASKMFGVPVEKITKGNPEYALRAKGKIAELALGYAGGTGALKNMGAIEMGLTEDELPPLVTQWRDANPHITKLWQEMDKQAKRAVRLPKGSLSYTSLPASGVPKAIKFYHTADGALRMRLPSGRSLIYRDVSVGPGYRYPDREQLHYAGTSADTKMIETHGGKLTENAVQAIARDCLAEAMKTLTALDYRIVLHVHDEVVIEVPEGESSAEEVAQIMSTPIAWAPGLPLNADAYECEYYRKD